MSTEASGATAQAWKPPPVGVMRAANKLIVPLLASPLHGLASHRLMLLEFTGRSTGRRYTIPVAYHEWDNGEVLAISTRPTWPRNLRGGRPARLRIKGRWHQATPTIIEDAEGVADILAEFVQRFGAKAVAKLRLGLPLEHPPTRDELLIAATRARAGRFRLTD